MGGYGSCGCHLGTMGFDYRIWDEKMEGILVSGISLQRH